MKIQKIVAVSSDMQHRVLDKGNTVPPWFNDYKNVSNWYNASTNPPDYAFFYNALEDNVYIQYGKNQQGWASARFFGQQLEVLDEVENDDGSIDVTVRTKPLFFRGHKNDIAIAGFRVKYEVKLNNKIVYSYTGNTIDSFSYGEKDTQEFTVNVKPSETSRRSALVMSISYPDGEFSDRDIEVGIGLYNPNPPFYIPMAIRKSKKWKDLDRNKGFIQIRKNNQLVDKSRENVGTSLQENKGKNRIRRANKWLQLPAMRF